jgi:hypothetical protein
MRDLPVARVFTRADLRALGWTDPAITRAARSGRLVPIRRGVYTCVEPDAATQAIAAARALADSVVSHRSALVLLNLPLIGSSTFPPEVTVAPTSRGSAHAAHLHRASLRPEDIVVIEGVAVTSVARTLVDVGRHRSTLATVAAADAALHTEAVDDEQIADVLRFCWNWPRIARAQRALRLTDGRAESPLESVSRVVMHWLGVPKPQPQTLIFDEHGRFLGRTDFYWDGPGVVGEADGRIKYDDREVLTDEKRRQELLEDPGLVVTRWGWSDPTRRRVAFVRRLERAFRRGYLRDRSGLPRQWSFQLT